ncbi:MAG: YhcH/YjgK/YiaL family protein [Sphaerochaetaceae bacterium]|nr:YhcH/YjgK/YiaL family protein [Sphaerochaetaceae bacterium]
MTSTKIGLEYKYDFKAKKFQLAFEFLKRKDLADLPDGTTELGEGVRASIQHYNSIDWDAGKFEAHERYFDIQYVMEGSEYCGVCDRAALGEVIEEYNETKDVTFYADPAHYSKVLLNSGDFIILGPEDAHKPSVKVDKSIPMKKVVVKVPIEAAAELLS